MRNRNISRHLWDALPWAAGRFALLLLLLGGWLFSFRTLWELPMEDGQLLGWCVLLSLAAAALWLLPQKLRWGLLGLAAAVGLLSLWQRESLASGLGELLIRAVAPLGDLFPVLPVPPADDSLTVALPGCFLWLSAWLALLLGFLVFLRCWWAVMTVCFLPLLPTILTGSLPSWGGFLAMLAGTLPLLFTALFRQEESRSLGWSSLLSLAMSLFLLLSLTVVLPQDTYEYPQWALDARNTLLELASGGLDSAMDWEVPWEVPAGQDGLSTPLLLYQGEQVDLSAAGPRHFTGRTVLEVEGTREGRVYLRGSSSSRYTGTSWEPIDEADYQELLQALASADPSREEQINALLYPADYLSGQEAASLTIRHVALSNSVAYVPYQPTSDTTQQLSLTRDTCFIRSSGQSSYTLSYYPDFLPGSSAASSSEEAIYQDFVYQHYLEVPEETAQLLADLSNQLSEMMVQSPEGLADNYRNAVTAALQTAQLLGELAVYDLNTPAMAEGEDFISHFLTEGRGYCVHFATTATMLLRMQGIPTRYVSGFTASVTPGETAKVPDSAAHAWVEIYLDGYGWYPVEVTPGGGESGTDTPETEDPTLPETDDDPAVDTPQPETPAVPVQPWEDTTTPDADDTDSEGTASSAQPLDLSWLRIPVGILLLGALGYGLERLASRLRRREEERPDTNPSVLSAYRRYRRLSALGTEENQLLEELGRKAKFSQHILTEEERSLAWQQLAAAAAPEALSRLSWWRRLLIRLLSRY